MAGESMRILDYRTIDPSKPPVANQFVSNQVRTSKYTMLNFLPVGLYLAFRLSTNFYFLIIAILQSWSVVSPVGPTTAVAPLVLVVGIVLLREAIEDHNRHILDVKTNTKEITVLRAGEMHELKWQDIQVGDIVQVLDNENFPADGLILSTSEPSGTCLIDTSNLDGEANLKTRIALPATKEIVFGKKDPLPAFRVKCEPPNVDLYKFTGILTKDSASFALDERQLLPRGSRLKNTRNAVLLVIYTGHETKMMLNAKRPYHKISHIDGVMNQIVVIIFVFQVLLCIVGAIYHSSWISTSLFEQLYVYPNGNSGSSDLVSGVLTFLSFVVLLNTFIPSSLVVSVELIKAIHSKFIVWDLQMRSDTGEGAVANTPALMEELGQVKYLFSDKTGTLTENRMEFRKCSVNGHIYEMISAISKKESQILTAEITTTGSDPTQTYTSTASLLNSPQSQKVQSIVHNQKMHALLDLQQATERWGSPEATFIEAMALCNTVMCDAASDFSSPSSVQYIADSPDEGALVRAARDLGLALSARTNSMITLTVLSGKNAGMAAKYEVLHILAFDSARKRMSIIIRTPNGTIQLICKGADCTILELCNDFGQQSKDTIMNHLKEFAIEGLRTLCIAKRALADAEYARWKQRYEAAELLMQGREASMEALVCEIEQKMTFLATTAIEDKLQDGVPETVARLLRAGIKIWVLTGDKAETAIEIGRSCGVIAKNMSEVMLQGSNVPEVAKNLASLRGLRHSKRLALIIDGFTLSFALMPQNRKHFLQFTMECAAVVVCRMSPLQKALVVELVKESIHGVTMAVYVSTYCGDGANDVSMIRAAHVGVGVAGQEGNQAVRSADFAIQQFRHLDRLLLFHGRSSYFRVTQCIKYFFYKNIIFTAPQFIYGIFSLFSGATYYTGIYIQAFNVFYTAAPVVARALLEKQLPDSTSMQFPELYFSGNSKLLFSLQKIGITSTIGLLHGFIVTLLPLSFLDGVHGINSMDFYCDGLTTYISIIFIVTFVIMLETCNWTTWTAFFYLGSLVLFIVSSLIYDGLMGEIYRVWTRLLSTPTFLLTMLLTVSVCVLPLLAIQGYSENFLEDRTDPIHILRRAKLPNKVMNSQQPVPGPNSSNGHT
ncbi:P-type ATPase (P-ATPase) Superfamily [Thraustotheca clavata]|uniref:Phospholipid-transporting ATPase n=1 Tax=Thraustotheca clavata TaxID=74557 RepID=A0A1W0A4Z9_9STRA|nr:P-type ATPase (P-ATPase) Superfamily [Thraustotheca clavata]